MNRYDLASWSDEKVKKLADSGDYTGIFEYACRMYAQEKYEESFRYFNKIKDYDNSWVLERMIDIADFYVKGIISDEEIVKLLKRRHSHGVSYYTYKLADCYEKGRGVEKNIKKYIELLTMVANDGSCSATIELAENYEKGYGVEKSLSKAYRLYYDYVDEHYKKDYWCAYKAALYMINEWGGAKKDMIDIEYHLRYASRVYEEARELYKELFGKDPEI